MQTFSAHIHAEGGGAERLAEKVLVPNGWCVRTSRIPEIQIDAVIVAVAAQS